MIGNIAARRYARALFALGKKKGLEELETYGKDLAALAAMLKENADLLRVFKNPIFSIEEKKNVIDMMMDKAGTSGTVKNFCRLLADKKRLDILPEIEAYFGELLDAEKGVVRGEVITAVELAEAKQKDVQSRLEGQAGKKLVLDFKADPDILGGLVLHVGDQVLDGSLRAQLDILKEQINRGE